MLFMDLHLFSNITLPPFQVIIVPALVEVALPCQVEQAGKDRQSHRHIQQEVLPETHAICPEWACSIMLNACPDFTCAALNLSTRNPSKVAVLYFSKSFS